MRRTLQPVQGIIKREQMPSGIRVIEWIIPIRRIVAFEGAGLDFIRVGKRI
jgi:hypothetical protein